MDVTWSRTDERCGEKWLFDSDPPVKTSLGSSVRRLTLVSLMCGEPRVVKPQDHHLGLSAECCELMWRASVILDLASQSRTRKRKVHVWAQDGFTMTIVDCCTSNVLLLFLFWVSMSSQSWCRSLRLQCWIPSYFLRSPSSPLHGFFLVCRSGLWAPYLYPVNVALHSG